MHTEPAPVAREGERLVRVQAVGLCGSDFHWFVDGAIGDAALTTPLVLGHEFAGVLENGQRVAVDPAISCGQCEPCRQGNPNLCPETRFAGHGSQDGALQEWIAWPAHLLHPVPDTFSPADGAMLEPLGVAIHAVNLGKIKPGMHVGVFGCGPIGLLIIQLAKLAGAAQITATDILPHRVQAAKQFGASQAYAVGTITNWVEMHNAVNTNPVHVAFDGSGSADAVEDAFESVRPGGKVILVGIPDDNRTVFMASIARRKGLTIKLVRRMKHTYPQAIDLVAKGLVDVRSLVTHHFPLSQASEAFQLAKQRKGLKTIIDL
jgi:L-iditol 2-dehydrogenase